MKTNSSGIELVSVEMGLDFQPFVELYGGGMKVCTYVIIILMYDSEISIHSRLIIIIKMYLK